jgi:hypothetical protein
MISSYTTNERELKNSSNMSIFVFLLASATLFYQADKSYWVSSVPDFILTISAILLLFVPWSAKLLFIFSILQIATVLPESTPHTSNNWLFISFLNLSILFAFVTVLIEKGVFPHNVSALESYSFPLIRACFFIFYFFVVFHKLNQDFFYPSLSCAADLYSKLSERFPILPQGIWADYISIYGTIISEAAIPILVATTRFRTLGLLYGSLFHYILGLNDFYAYSSMLIALYFSFAPSSFNRGLQDFWNQFSKAKYYRYIKIALVVLWVLLFLAILAVLAVQNENLNLRRFTRSGAYALWILYSPLVMVLYFTVMRRVRDQFIGTVSLLKPRRLWHVSLLLIVFFNGICPYLGLKTETSFAMFSNLRTENGYWNHLILPEWMKIAHYQDDLVTIVFSSHPELQGYKDRSEKLTTFEFQKVTNRICRDKYNPVQVQLFHNEKFYGLEDVCAFSFLTKQPNVIAGKLLRFRPIKDSSGSYCTYYH